MEVEVGSRLGLVLLLAPRVRPTTPRKQTTIPMYSYVMIGSLWVFLAIKAVQKGWRYIIIIASERGITETP